MSPESLQLFNTWFPAIVVGFGISLLAAALWDILRRKIWLFVSGYCPGVLKEVGLDDSSLSRTEVLKRDREEKKMLSAAASLMSFLKPANKSLAMAEPSNSGNSSTVIDIEAGTDITDALHDAPKTGNGGTFTTTARCPDDTPVFVFVHIEKMLKRIARRPVRRLKGSVMFQASLDINANVLAAIEELAKFCMQVESRCTFQLANWAILYYNAGEVRLRLLEEGEVPVNVEARWQDDERKGITVRGCYLNGAQIKAATKETSTTLRSACPAVQGCGDLDELDFDTEEADVPGEDSFIYASKVVDADGISLIVRSEASSILPARQNFSLIEALRGQFQWISLSAKKMIKLLLRIEDGQLETTDNRPELRFDDEHLIVEHWNGVSEIELLDKRKKVLHYLRELRASGIVGRAGPQPPDPHVKICFCDEHEVKYWQRALQDLNEVIHRNTNDPQTQGTHIFSIRGGIKFLLGDFEDALQDFDLADRLNTGGHDGSSVLLERRALVKCILGRYSEAMEDVLAVITMNPNLNDIHELRRCLEQILHQQASFQRVQTYGSFICQRPDARLKELIQHCWATNPQDRPTFHSICNTSRECVRQALSAWMFDTCQRPEISQQPNSMVEIPDLLTGDEWHAGERVSPCTVSDDISAGDSTTVASSSMSARLELPESIEAASCDCHRNMPGLELQVGDRLLVADMGGRTTDIIVHECISDLTPEELHYRVIPELSNAYSTGGGLCGGTYVNDKFNKFLLSKVQCLSPGSLRKSSASMEVILKRWEPEIPWHLADLPTIGDQSSFETQLPSGLAAQWEAFAEEQGNEHRASYDELELTSAEMREIFDPVVDHNLDLIADHLSRTSNVKAICVVVGGFAGSPYLLSKLKERLPGIHVTENVISCNALMLARLNRAARFTFPSARKTYWFKRYSRAFQPWDPEAGSWVGANNKSAVNFSAWVKKGVANLELQHPNLVSFFDLPGRTERRNTKTSFVDRLHKELMDHDLRSIIDIMLQIAKGMLYLHEPRNLIHRDLKALNILCNPGYDLWKSQSAEYYTAKLVDFGISKISRPQSSYATTPMAGTCYWRAPEIFHMRDTDVPPKYTFKADVYSFAMSCFEIVTGRMPFEDEPNYHLHARIMAGERPSLDDLLRLDVPDALKELIQQCWATNPDDRPSFDYIVNKLWDIRASFCECTET